MQITRYTLLAIGGVTAGCGPQVSTTPAPVPERGAVIRYATRQAPERYATARLVSLDPYRLVFRNGDTPWPTASLPTREVAALQTRIGERRNADRGALIGLAAGGVAGVVCVGAKDAGAFWAGTAGGAECLLAPAAGLLSGALIGALTRRDVWAPVVVPRRPTAPVPPPVPTAIAVGAQVRIRLPGR